MVHALKVKQQSEEIRFLKNNLETKIKENESLSQSL